MRRWNNINHTLRYQRRKIRWSHKKKGLNKNSSHTTPTPRTTTCARLVAPSRTWTPSPTIYLIRRRACRSTSHTGVPFGARREHLYRRNESQEGLQNPRLGDVYPRNKCGIFPYLVETLVLALFQHFALFFVCFCFEFLAELCCQVFYSLYPFLENTKNIFPFIFWSWSVSFLHKFCFIMICKGVIFQEHEGIHHMEENVKLVYERYVLWTRTFEVWDVYAS